MDNKTKMTAPEQNKKQPNVAAPVATPSYPSGDPLLPKHFSCLNAQHGPQHDQDAHAKLGDQLKAHGYQSHEIHGFYGSPELSYMVPHDGSPEAKKTLEGLAFQHHGQESIIHSTDGYNELKMGDGSPSWTGHGLSHGDDFKDFYSVMPSGHKVRLNVTPQAATPIKKSDATIEPHCYGKKDGIWIFQATHPSHAALVGDKYSDLKDEEFPEALEHAKKRKVSSIVLSGTPPTQLLNSIHPQLGAMEAGKVTRTDLKKAFLQPDGGTVTDTTAHSQAYSSLSDELKEWGAKNLSKLPRDAIETLSLGGQIVKVRKHDADLYSGWIENNGNRTHMFEKLTMPELMVQLRSKLELYGEKSVAEVPKVDLGAKIKQLRDKIRSEIKTPEGDSDGGLGAGGTGGLGSEGSEADKFAKEHEKKVEAFEAKKELPEIIPGKDLVSGISTDDAPSECEACGSRNSFCDCYQGLPKPQVEYDFKSRKLTILFKSEWDMESRASFVEDLKRNAGRILKNRYNK